MQKIIFAPVEEWMRLLVLFLLSFSFLNPSYALPQNSPPDFKNDDCQDSLSRINQLESSDSPEQFQTKLSKTLLETVKSRGKKLRGYAILVGTMVGSSALSFYLISQLSPHLQFLSQLIGQITVIGVIFFGAPIWSRIASKVTKMGHHVMKDNPFEGNETNRQLEELWNRTQQNYSLNSQMSRNILNNFIIAVKQNFYEAHRAMNSDDPRYAADQIAEAAIRLRLLFKDISPDDPSLVIAIKTSFVDHLNFESGSQEMTAFKARIQERIFELNPDAALDPALTVYYQKTLESWLN